MSLFFVSVVLVFFFNVTAFASSQSLTKSTAVTSHVPDIQDPLPPLLIAPQNNSLINVSQLKFIWDGSSDNVAISFYRIWLDGEILIAKIEPAVGIDNVFTFLSSAHLEDGEHSWQIEAVDTSDNSRFSATWTFTIDTLAPAFSINQIGNIVTTINAPADLDQDQPYIVSTGTPTLSGKGEPENLAKLSIITAEGQSVGDIQFVIDGNGTWSIKLPKLKENTIYYLTLIIQDQAGNISIINKVPILFKKDNSFLVPPIIENVIDQQNNLIGLLPHLTGLTQRQSYSLAGSFAVALWLMTSITLGVVYLSLKIGKLPNFSSLGNIFWILGWWPYKNKVGLVYDTSFNHHVSLAKISIFRLTNDSNAYLVNNILTNRYGEYQTPILSQGKYKLICYHQHSIFPAWKKRPQGFSFLNFYLGEEFAIKDISSPLPVVGIPIMSDQRQYLSHSFLLDLSSWRGFSGWFVHLPICSIITLMFPSAINALSFAFYMLLLLYKYKK